jgi:hypothetical protein
VIDSESIDLVREQRRSTEYELLSKYILDKDLRILSQMGLALRKIENDPVRCQELRGKVLKKYGLRGLHIAGAVQNEIISTFIGIDASATRNPIDLMNRIQKMLNEVDKYVVFVSPEDSVDVRVRQITSRIDVEVPDTVVLYGPWGARTTVHRITSKLEKTFKEYEFTTVESKIKTIVVIEKLR